MCQVLGPYTCSDCSRIRLHERQRHEQHSLYPGVAVDPRTLVAPGKLRRMTATLPPSILHTGQKVTLQCGCQVRRTSVSVHVKCLIMQAISFNPFTANWENAMSLLMPGVPAPCEKFPHSSQLNFE
jgi:hypothetical protein